MFTSKQLKTLHDNIKDTSTKQLSNLINFYEENIDYFEHDSFDFIPDRGFSFKEVALVGDTLCAVFTMRGWEHNTTYRLDVVGGYEIEMQKMVDYIEHIKILWKEQEKEELIKRKAEYEKLKAEFE